MDFTLSNYPHFDSAYLVKVRFSLDLAVDGPFKGHQHGDKCKKNKVTTVYVDLLLSPTDVIDQFEKVTEKYLNGSKSTAVWT